MVVNNSIKFSKENFWIGIIITIIVQCINCMSLRLDEKCFDDLFSALLLIISIDQKIIIISIDQKIIIISIDQKMRMISDDIFYVVPFELDTCF